MGQSIKRRLFFLFGVLSVLLFVTVSCSQSPIGGENLTGDSSGSDSGTGDDGSTDAGSEESGSGSEAGEGEALPVASIPIPAAIKSISFNEDSNALDPTVFFSGAIDTSSMTDSDGNGYADDYWIALSEISMEESTASVGANLVFAQNAGWKGIVSYLRAITRIAPTIPSAHAAPASGLATSLSVTDNTVCSQDGVTCCEISMSGDTECYPSFTSTTYYAAITDGTDMGDQITLTQHEQILWLANSPGDVTGTGDQAYSITDGVAVQIADDSGVLRVNGDHADTTEAYRAFDVSGTNLAYDSSSDYLGIMDTATGITALDLTGTLAGSRTVDGATAYTKIKTATNNGVYFGAEIASETEAWVYDYFQSVTGDEFVSSEDIRFITSGDLDSSSVQMTHAKTLSFDVNSDGYALVVYQDMAGNTRIRASNGTTTFGGESSLVVSGSSPDFKDIHFVNDEKALLVDSANDMVWVITLDTTSQTVTSTLSSSNGISVGDSPVAIKFNSDKSRAYVLNQGDESLSVINLRNSDSSLRSSLQVVLTSRITDVISDIDLTFTPSSLAWIGDRESLIVGLEGTKSLLVIDASDLISAETSVADEDNDNDNDGYTGSEGDCDDTDSSLNPTTVWYADSDSDNYGASTSSAQACEQPTGYVSNSTDCDDDDNTIYPTASELCDSADNDCDGTTDEDTTSVTWYRDSDGDTYGNASVTTSSCSRPGLLWVTNSSDCNDSAASAYPGASEDDDDGIDNDCDGTIDEVDM